MFAEAIDTAFARWDLSHLHNFDLGDGRLIGDPDDSFALDHSKLKVPKEVKPGEKFEYVFDYVDDWRHRCVVEPEKGDPLEEYSFVPVQPVAIWGWGSIPHDPPATIPTKSWRCSMPCQTWQPTIATAADEELQEIFRAFDVSILYDKDRQLLTLAATITPELVPDPTNENDRPAGRSQINGVAGAGSGRNPATALEPNIVVYRTEESWPPGERVSA